MRGNTILDVQDLTRLQDEGHSLDLEGFKFCLKLNNSITVLLGLGLGNDQYFKAV